MENLDNVRNNLENLIYLYENFRFEENPDCLTFEYQDEMPLSELQNKLNDYFIVRSWDEPNTWLSLDLVGKDTLIRSLNAFRKISQISVYPKDKLISLRFQFLASPEIACEAFELLENNNVQEFSGKYEFFDEKRTWTETDCIMLIAHHLDSLVEIKREED